MGAPAETSMAYPERDPVRGHPWERAGHFTLRHSDQNKGKSCGVGSGWEVPLGYQVVESTGQLQDTTEEGGLFFLKQG